MNRREAYQIPMGEPTDFQLDEINKRLDDLKEEGSKAINIGRAFVPSSINNAKFVNDFKFGRQHCKYASKFLIDPKRELVFALIDYHLPNGFALPCGEFDAVLITTGFFVHLDSLMQRVFSVFFNGDMSAITAENNFKKDFVSFCDEKKIDYSNDLLEIVRRLSISHIIGHEFGHLALGHCGFASNPQTEEIENSENKISLAANIREVDLVNLVSQAREIDADVQAASWVESLLNAPTSLEHPEILNWLKADRCRLSFIFSISSLLWYVNLGAKGFSTKDIPASTTHPPTSFRAKTIFDSALMQNVQRDSVNKYRHELFATEAFYIVALGEALKRKFELQDKIDVQ